MLKRIVAPLIALFAVLGFAHAGSNGGYISGTVMLAKSIKSWDTVMVLVCNQSDEMCVKPAAVFKPKPILSNARSAPYASPKLPAGKYTVYALNDKNGNLAHDPDDEELGGYFKEGTFEPILLEPTTRGVKIDMIGF
jgi:uncharacterized protein (DUF2141 family)